MLWQLADAGMIQAMAVVVVFVFQICDDFLKISCNFFIAFA